MKRKELLTVVLGVLMICKCYCVNWQNIVSTVPFWIRDRILRGINDAEIQRRLLGEAGLTLKGAFEIALTMESATKSCTELKSTSVHVLDRDAQSISQPVYRLQGKSGIDKTR